MLFVHGCQHNSANCSEAEGGSWTKRLHPNTTVTQMFSSYLSNIYDVLLFATPRRQRKEQKHKEKNENANIKMSKALSNERGRDQTHIRGSLDVKI